MYMPYSTKKKVESRPSKPTSCGFLGHIDQKSTFEDWYFPFPKKKKKKKKEGKYRLLDVGFLNYTMIKCINGRLNPDV